jgi:hypothetical protein
VRRAVFNIMSDSQSVSHDSFAADGSAVCVLSMDELHMIFDICCFAVNMQNVATAKKDESEVCMS